MKDFVKTVIRNFSKQYRQQTLPEDLHTQVTNLFHKEKKKYSWRRFRNRATQSALAYFRALVKLLVSFQASIS